MLTRPRALLQLEGAVLFALALLLYWRLGGNWLLFVVLVLAPDLGMLGYVRNTRLGAATYNAFRVPHVRGAVDVGRGRLVDRERCGAMAGG